MLKDLKVEDFVEKTASNDPVPGGGSIAALSGAIAAALVEMVANLTIGKKKYENAESKMMKIQKDIEIYRNEFLNLIDEDANAFDLVMKAFKLPKETDEDKNIRGLKIQESFKIAATAPMKIAKKSYELMYYCEEVIKGGNKNAVTDGMVATMLARTATLSAIVNVRINLSSIKDEKFVEDLNNEIDILESKVKEKESIIIESIKFK